MSIKPDSTLYYKLIEVGKEGEIKSNKITNYGLLLGGTIAGGIILLNIFNDFESTIGTNIVAACLQTFAIDILFPISIFTKTNSIQKRDNAFFDYGIRSEYYNMMNITHYKNRAINSMWVSIGCNVISIGSLACFFISNSYNNVNWLIPGLGFEIPALIFAFRSLNASKKWSQELNNSIKIQEPMSSNKIYLSPSLGFVQNEYSNKMNVALGLTLKF